MLGMKKNVRLFNHQRFYLAFRTHRIVSGPAADSSPSMSGKTTKKENPDHYTILLRISENRNSFGL
jgi:hypothetical protein